MRLLNPNECVAWLADRSIEVDGVDACGLRFRLNRHQSRFWLMPQQISRDLPMVNGMLDGLGSWESCLAWFPGGRWPVGVEGSLSLARAAVHRAFGIPDGHTGAVAFDRAERGQLLALTHFQMLDAGDSADDVFLIPDHGQGFLMISHHEVIHATFARPGLIAPFVALMAEHGHPLPTEPPDPTFKPQPWMTRLSPNIGFVSPNDATGDDPA